MRLYITMPVGDFYGWAICGKNLFNNFKKLMDIRYVPFDIYDSIPRDYNTNKFIKEITDVPNGNAFNYLQAIDNLNPKLRYKGDKNIGYMFYESEHMPDNMVDDLKGYDIIATGSDWNTNVLKSHGFDNAVTINQGVDTELFKPKPSAYFKDAFVVYSGGKFEHRKGQDIVAKCVGNMQKKYNDVFLITAWENIFDLDGYKKDIESVKKYLMHNKTIMSSISWQVDTLNYIAESSIGLFPNRCEGGTNLVMMEYMACGKPVIATNTSGQSDVLDHKYAITLDGDNDSKLIDQCMDALEYSYHNRNKLSSMGLEARKSMKQFTWEKAANKFKDLFKEN